MGEWYYLCILQGTYLDTYQMDLCRYVQVCMDVPGWGV